GDVPAARRGVLGRLRGAGAGAGYVGPAGGRLRDEPDAAPPTGDGGEHGARRSDGRAGEPASGEEHGSTGHVAAARSGHEGEPGCAARRGGGGPGLDGDGGAEGGAGGDGGSGRGRGQHGRRAVVRADGEGEGVGVRGGDGGGEL